MSNLGYECVECGRRDRDIGQFCQVCWYCNGCVATTGHDPEGRAHLAALDKGDPDA